MKLDQLQADLAVSPVIEFEPNDSQQTRASKLTQMETLAGISPPIDFEPNDSQQTRASKLNGMQSSGPPPVFPTGATHYWALNEPGADDVRVDSIGGLDLTPTGSPPQIAGPLDFGVSINGGGGAHYLASAVGPSLRTGGLWTFNFWTKAIGTLDAALFFRQGSTNADGALDSWLYAQSGSTNSNIRLSNGSGHTGTDLTMPSALFDGGWHMFTVRLGNVADTLDFYLDGSFFETHTNSKAVNASSLPVQIGQDSDTGGADAQGMADVATWSRALTDQEITDLYSGGTPLRP